MDLYALACEEARDLYEREFHHYNPYSREINTQGIPYDKEENFCQMVEAELSMKGEKIIRTGRYFKIARYQRR